MLPNLFYFNPLFDLELGSYPVDRVRQSASEMGPLFSFCGNHNDRILLDVCVPEAYHDYLDSLSITRASPLGPADDPTLMQGFAWGWNLASVERLSSLKVFIDHPDLETVRKINNRAFCAAFNRATGTGIPGTRFCASVDDIRLAVEELRSDFSLVAKPAFGGSGMGFVTIECQDDVDINASRLINNNGCTIEPWCDRIYDLSSSCVIHPDGTIADLRHYRCFTNRRGMFHGVLFGDDAHPALTTWRDTLEGAVQQAAAAVAKEGYYGPVSFDSIVYRDTQTGQDHLAPVIEINGRWFMSAIAYALHQKIGDDRVCLFRFVGKKNIQLPESYEDLTTWLGNDAYDSATRRGIITLSPLRILRDGKPVQPARSAFFLVGSNREEVEKMELEILQSANKHRGSLRIK